jgi:hypothetical protein
LNIDGSASAVEETARLVGRIRARWPKVRIILRADPGFAREALMVWCEVNKVDYVFGLARNARLEARIAGALAEARRSTAVQISAGRQDTSSPPSRSYRA